ncbi:serpin family protein [Streptomyces sp. NPDC005438]|uniref:serpin family protein n=1 Tax=Streptomyces sp. NPDC005438 TaxID=3156880 RepID=UPI0033B29EE3
MRDAGTTRAVNALTRRWLDSPVGPDRGEGLFLAVGVWPLLALLAAGAEGSARTELAGALGLAELGVSPERAAARAAELVEDWRQLPGCEAALGVWLAPGVEVEPSWRARLSPGDCQWLTGDRERDRKALDRWASTGTGGAVERMPVTPGRDTALVLASALSVRTRWREPFAPGWEPWTPTTGPWAGRTLASLHRISSDPDQVSLAHTGEGPLTLVRVEGDTGVDVHLLLGPREWSARSVLSHGLEALAGDGPTTPGGELPEGEPGPGLWVGEVPGWDDAPRSELTTVPFTVTADLDLLASPDTFGLESARDHTSRPLPGISRSVPLEVGAARQAATASFSAEGFHTAAVTALDAVAAGLPPATHRLVSARCDRPFGFAAVHRGSGLVLAAGWVAEPEEFQEPPEPD